MVKPIKVTGESVPDAIPVRRRSRGRMTAPMNITIPVELHQTINGIIVKTSKSRSLVITELIEKGLKNNE